MPNDDLGQFPMPSSASSPTEPAASPSQPATSMDNNTPTPATPASTFEETPDEIPSMANPPAAENPVIPQIPYAESQLESPVPPVTSEAAQISSPFVPQETPQPLPAPVNAPLPPVNQPIPATLPTTPGLNMGPIIFAVIFIVAVLALAGAAFLFQQTQSLKGQLSDITKTLQKQQTAPETTPTPSIIEVPSSTPTPTTTPASTVSATPTPTPTPTPQVFVPGSPMKPLSVAAKVMQIAINHQPNAQLILIKTENANDPVKATTKYFFRQDLTTKKYFYVLISGSNQPEVVDKQIYVTPDDNIPSLNDLVLQDNLGIDLDAAVAIVNSACPDANACTSASAKAQYIKTTAGVIWQISLTVAGQADPMVMQINAQTKAILFKTDDFSK